MKFIQSEGQIPVVELSRRNLEILLLKLDDPLSNRSLLSGGDLGERVYVKAVENEDHYADRNPGTMYMPSADEVI